MFVFVVVQTPQTRPALVTGLVGPARRGISALRRIRLALLLSLHYVRFAAKRASSKWKHQALMGYYGEARAVLMPEADARNSLYQYCSLRRDPTQTRTYYQKKSSARIYVQSI